MIASRIHCVINRGGGGLKVNRKCVENYGSFGLFFGREIKTKTSSISCGAREKLLNNSIVSSKLKPVQTMDVLNQKIRIF